MNCLTYLLSLINQGYKLTIMYNHEHCIGVENNKVYDLKNWKGVTNIEYAPLETWHAKEVVKDMFGLDEYEYKILEKYYDCKIRKRS